MRNLLLAIAIGCACPALVTTAEARSSYDGAWSLIFYTQRGACDQSYNFLVNITNGVVTKSCLSEVQGIRGGFRRGSRVRDRPRQVRLWIGQASGKLGTRKLERPLRA